MKLKISDATKDELIQYFFGVEGLGGGYRIGADKDRFLIWLERKRTDTLLKAGESAADAAQKELKEYIRLVRAANEKTDLDEMLNIFEQANKAYQRYEEFNRQYDLAIEKANKMMNIK